MFLLSPPSLNYTRKSSISRFIGASIETLVSHFYCQSGMLFEYFSCKTAWFWQTTKSLINFYLWSIIINVAFALYLLPANFPSTYYFVTIHKLTLIRTWIINTGRTYLEVLASLVCVQRKLLAKQLPSTCKLLLDRFHPLTMLRPALEHVKVGFSLLKREFPWKWWFREVYPKCSY